MGWLAEVISDSTNTENGPLSELTYVHVACMWVRAGIMLVGAEHHRQNMCSSDQAIPYTLTIFPEGTRLTPEKLRDSQDRGGASTAAIASSVWMQEDVILHV